MMGWVMSHRSLFLCFNTGLKSSATLLTKFSQSWNTYRRSIIWFQFHPLVTPLSPLPRSCLKTGIKKSFIYDFEMHTLSLESILWFISPACWFFILKNDSSSLPLPPITLSITPHLFHSIRILSTNPPHHRLHILLSGLTSRFSHWFWEYFLFFLKVLFIYSF